MTTGYERKQNKTEIRLIVWFVSSAVLELIKLQRVFLLALVIFNVVAKMYNFWICICCSSIVLTRQSLAKPLLAGERPPLLPLSWTFRSGNAGGFILHLSTAYVRFYFALVEPRHLRRGCSSFSIRSEMPQPATPTMHQYFVKASSSQLPMPSIWKAVKYAIMAFSWPSYPEAQKGYLPPRKTTTPKSHSEEDRYHQGRFQTQSGGRGHHYRLVQHPKAS